MDFETSPAPHPRIRDVDRETLTLKQVEAEIRKVIVGQDYLIDRLLVGLLSRAHLRWPHECGAVFPRGTLGCAVDDAPGSPAAERDGPRLSVVVEDGLVSVAAEDVSLEGVLAAISRESRVAIVGLDGIEYESVSVSFDGVSPDAAVRWFLEGYDTFFFYTACRKSHPPPCTRCGSIRRAKART